MKKLLIANRGEIARRIIRTARAMGIATVAVHSDADAHSLHVREADAAVHLRGNASADTYLRIDLLIAAARSSGADAVHPGYGFLSENADFAQAVQDAGLIWVGPPPAAIRALGSKSGAKQLAQQHGVPCLPGYQGLDQSDDRFVAEAAAIGYPVMVKATAGGGGRGMRLVTEATALPAALQSARSEALSSFGSAELLIERALLNPRHVEVQVFADTHGHAIHLGERDCSVQRRHQKIIEEAPSPVVSPTLRAELGRAAVALAQAAGYVGAGTVEFLVDATSFFLMEMNTRLQVEHPVTEALTGLDLVEWQIRVARGEALPLTQEQVRWQGHAIEVRLCAEDENYVPHTGSVLHLRLPRGALRFDHALETGAEVSPYYDAMLGKLITHGATRDEAIDRLREGLDDLVLLGLPTNRAFLSACLDHPVFRAGQALIPFLAQHGDGIRSSLQKQEQEKLVQSAASMVFSSNPAVQRLPAPFARPVRVGHRGSMHDVPVRELGAGAVRVADQEFDCAQLPPAVCLDGQRWHVFAGAVDLWLDDTSHAPPDAHGASGGTRDIRAPFNGKLVRLAVAEGDSVAAGQLLLVIESMKIEHQINAPQAGRVASVRGQAGQQVAPGQALLQLEATT